MTLIDFYLSLHEMFSGLKDFPECTLSNSEYCTDIVLSPSLFLLVMQCLIYITCIIYHYFELNNCCFISWY